MPYILPERAVELLREYAYIQVTLTKEENTGRGCTKKSLKEEKRLAKLLFNELTGFLPTAEQLEAMEVK